MVGSSDFDKHLDLERKQERNIRRWEMVLDKKHSNTEEKQRSMKEQLAKKFKREKEMMVKAKEKSELDAYDADKRAEKIANIHDRRKTNDDKI